MWGLLFLLFLFHGWRCYWALPLDLPVLTFTFEWLCLGNSAFYPNVVTFPTKDSACLQQAWKENVPNLIFNHCRAGNSSKGDTGHCWMLFLMEGYSSFPSFLLLFFPSCHYKSGPFSPPDIRHPEELSLLRKPRDPSKKKKKKLDDQCEDDTFELEGPLITPGSGELGTEMGMGGKLAQQRGADWISWGLCKKQTPNPWHKSWQAAALGHTDACHALPGAEQPQASQNQPEPECGHLNTQILLLRAFLTLLRKERNGKPLLVSHCWRGLGCATVLLPVCSPARAVFH